MHKAYNKLYLQDATDLMELVFRTVAREKEYDFDYFVEGFMNCLYRKLMDEGSSRVINMTYDELLAYLHRYCPEIFKAGTCDIDYMMATWIGGMYNRIQFETAMSSKEIYKQIPVNRMKAMFIPLHTVSEEAALNKIIPTLKTVDKT